MPSAFRLLRNQTAPAVSLRTVRQAAADHGEKINQHANTLNTELIPAVQGLASHAQAMLPITLQSQAIYNAPFKARLRWLLFGELPKVDIE